MLEREWGGGKQREATAPFQSLENCNLGSHVEGGAEVKGVREKALRKIFEVKKHEITGEWRKLQILGYMHGILRLTIRNLKSRRLRWAGHVARMEQSRNA